MFSISRSFFILVSVCLFLTACGGGSSSSNSSNKRVTSLVTLGDSIGAGACGTAPWGLQLAAALGVPVVNDSVFSRTTAIGLGRVDALLAAHKPSHLVVLLGTNDARQGRGDAVSNMTAIVQKARAAGVVPIIGTVPGYLLGGGIDAAAAGISAGYQGIAGAIVADVRGALGNNPALYCDGIHPNAAGQTAIVSAFRGRF